MEDLDFTALIIDAKHVAGKQMVVALGVTIEGRKIPLGFAEASTEHHGPVKGLLRDLIDRGLTFDQGILTVTDGARGLHKAIREIFGDRALIYPDGRRDKGISARTSSAIFLNLSAKRGAGSCSAPTGSRPTGRPSQPSKSSTPSFSR